MSERTSKKRPVVGKSANGDEPWVLGAVVCYVLTSCVYPTFEVSDADSEKGGEAGAHNQGGLGGARSSNQHSGGEAPTQGGTKNVLNGLGAEGGRSEGPAPAEAGVNGQVDFVGEGGAGQVGTGGSNAEAGRTNADGGGAGDSGGDGLGGDGLGGRTGQGGDSVHGGGTGDGNEVSGGRASNGGLAGQGGEVESAGQTSAGSGGCGDISSSRANCGRCGHDCGPGSSCRSGSCEPATIISGIDGATALAVGQPGLFFILADQLLSCPLSGCGNLVPQQLTNNQKFSPYLVVTNDSVVFSISLNLWTLNFCPTSGCPATPSVMYQGSAMFPLVGLVARGSNVIYGAKAHQGNIGIARCAIIPDGCTLAGGSVHSGFTGSIATPFTADESTVYFHSPAVRDQAAALTACSIDDTCTTLTTRRAGLFGTVDWENPNFMSAVAGNLFAAFDDVIDVCPSTGCSVATRFVAPVSPTLGLTSDTSGVYWLQGDVKSASIQYCPVTGCVGGARVLATNQVSVSDIEVFGDSVYWISAGKLDDLGSVQPGTGAIYRVAK